MKNKCRLGLKESANPLDCIPKSEIKNVCNGTDVINCIKLNQEKFNKWILPKLSDPSDIWLSNFDLDVALEGFQHLFRSIHFLKTVPSDYYMNHKVPRENFAQIINTDPSYKSGKHWVAVFKRGDIIEYFDPTGDKPNRNISFFLNHYPNVIISNKKHQRGNNYCGIYSLFFILARSSDISLNEINNQRLSDNKMKMFHKKLFQK